jgi:hypothetical protein
MEAAMSHIVTIATEMRDPDVLPAACDRLGLPPPEAGEVRFLSGRAVGTKVRLPGWQYPVVIEADGTLRYDNYGGQWGDPGQLDRLRQAYAVEKVVREAQRERYRVRESPQRDGSVRLYLMR